MLLLVVVFAFAASAFFLIFAGLLIAETDYHTVVEVMTAPFKGLALGVFLITVGMSLDLRVIAQNWQSLLTAVIGVVALTVLAWKAWRGKYSREYYTPVEIGGLYWHFVDLVWVFLFPLLYLVAHR